MIALKHGLGFFSSLHLGFCLLLFFGLSSCKHELACFKTSETSGFIRYLKITVFHFQPSEMNCISTVKKMQLLDVIRLELNLNKTL